MTNISTVSLIIWLGIRYIVREFTFFLTHTMARKAEQCTSDLVHMESMARGAKGGSEHAMDVECGLCHTVHTGSYSWEREWLSAAERQKKLAIPEQFLHGDYFWLCIECHNFYWPRERPKRRSQMSYMLQARETAERAYAISAAPYYRPPPVSAPFPGDAWLDAMCSNDELALPQRSPSSMDTD